MANMIDKYKFETEWDKKVAQYFLDKGSNILFALAVDYPGLYKIPMCFHEIAKKSLKELNLRSNPKYRKDGSFPPGYRIFFLGPRPTNRKWYRPSCTTKENATSFKIVMYAIKEEIGFAGLFAK